MKFGWIWYAGLILITACAAQTPAPFRLAGSKWTLTNLTQNGTMQIPAAGTKITLEFSENGQVSGSSGCNSYGGTYKAQGEILDIGALVSTLRACVDPNAMKMEAAYVGALQEAQMFSKSADGLTITFANGSGKLEFTAQ